MKRLRVALYSLALLFGAFHAARAQELVFATAQEASRILASRDDFVERMSPFDRAARMKTSTNVSEKTFLEFVASATLEWRGEESRAVSAAYAEIRPALAQLALPLPSRIYLVKTTGTEEGNAAYTRANAIVLPTRMLDSSERELRRILAHELFHIATRAHPQLSRLLYGVIGFRYCGEVEFPAALTTRKITNPDAPKNDHCIRVKVRDESVWAMPILFSRVPTYDSIRGGEFFEYLTLGLLLVDWSGGTDRARPLQDAQNTQAARVVGLEQVSGFIEQVGRNTRYIIHPEEILADNFALLVLGEREVPSPEVLSKIRETLETFRASKSK